MIQFICVGWISGVATMGKSFPILQSLLLPSIFLFMLSCILQLTLFKKVHSLWFKFLQGILALGLGITLGADYASLQLNERLQFREKKPEHAEIIVYIKNLNQLSETSIQQKVHVFNRYTEVVQWQAFIKNEGRSSAQPELELGHYYRMQGQIRPAHSYATPGAFDQEKWYIQQNIMAGFKVESVQELSEQEIYRLGYGRYLRDQQGYLHQIKLAIERQRLALRGFITQQPLSHKGLLLALLTGDQSLLHVDTEDLFQRFGMSHLLAISGPHVLIFAFLFCWGVHHCICRYWPELYLKWPKQYLLLVPFLLCVLWYCAFVGFEIPALRTLLSCVLISTFILLKQNIKPLAILLLSASVLLIFDPFSILSAAFWLSYGACLVLLRIYQTVQQRSRTDQIKSKAQWLKIQLRILIETQWKIFLALLPLMLIFFKQIAWMTPLSNLFAIPWIGLVIVPLDIIAALSYFIFEPFGSLIFQLNDLCVSILLILMQALDTLFSPELQPIAMNFWVILSLCLGLVILFLPRGVVPKTWAILCCVPFIFMDTNKNEFELSVLDVGQGQAIFIRDQAQTLMVDTGGNYDEDQFSVGKHIILPFLSVKGVDGLTQLVLSHLDQDHSGAYETIKQDLKVKQVYANEQVNVAASSQFNYCYQGQTWHWQNDVRMRVLSPKKEQLAYAKHEKNEYSCVLYLQVKNAQPYQNFLLMGDAGWQTEYQILQHYPDLKVDVLVLGHHGSRHSSAYAFLKHFNPKLAIASAGFNNRYGHPSVMLEARLKALNIPLLSTIDKGSIHFSKHKNTMLVGFERDTQQWLKR